MKSKLLVLVAILAVALMAVPASAAITSTDLFFTVPNTGGLTQYTLGPGEYFAKLTITVDTNGGATGPILT
jgi:hypothetical protein